ncbi:MAG: glutathione S-transferase N-terminal domain-containing protein [Microbacteriaceae bacterium]|nr:glutathione S-transferase N-terminal domain-containing protein [Microbacteriaceae bacterium]
MKLYYGRLSPFVRKVMVLAHEKNLVATLELIPVTLTPTEPDRNFMRINPLGKIPTLALDDGTVLIDSPVVCEYLDTLGEGPRFVPASGPARLHALRLNALGDGLLEAGMNVRVEGLRPAGTQWDKWIAAQQLKVDNALDALDGGAFVPSGSAITLGEIAVGCALGWLDFRMPQFDWRSGRPSLAAWYAAFSERPAMQATAPK